VVRRQSPGHHSSDNLPSLALLSFAIHELGARNAAVVPTAVLSCSRGELAIRSVASSPTSRAPSSASSTAAAAFRPRRHPEPQECVALCCPAAAYVVPSPCCARAVLASLTHSPCMLSLYSSLPWRAAATRAKTYYDTTKKLQQDCRKLYITQSKIISNSGHDGVLVAADFQNSLTTGCGWLSLWVHWLGKFHSYPVAQGIELGGFELAKFDRRRELWFLAHVWWRRCEKRPQQPLPRKKLSEARPRM
jgi:hypothetical protein